MRLFACSGADTWPTNIPAPSDGLRTKGRGEMTDGPGIRPALSEIHRSAVLDTLSSGTSNEHVHFDLKLAFSTTQYENESLEIPTTNAHRGETGAAQTGPWI